MARIDRNKLKELEARAAVEPSNPRIAGSVVIRSRRVPGLKSAKSVRREMAFVYREVWNGHLDTVQAARLTTIGQLSAQSRCAQLL